MPADIFARYHRLCGNHVLMVSGSDAHGTPITVRADLEGKTASEIYKSFHDGFLNLFMQLGISYDLFTTTHSENHFKVSQTIFKRLLDNDSEALIAATTAPMGTDGVEELLSGLSVPFMLYCGDRDGFFPSSKAASDAIPGSEFVPLQGMDHGQVSRDSDLILPHISRFLEKATLDVGVGR